MTTNTTSATANTTANSTTVFSSDNDLDEDGEIDWDKAFEEAAEKEREKAKNKAIEKEREQQQQQQEEETKPIDVLQLPSHTSMVDHTAPFVSDSSSSSSSSKGSAGSVVGEAAVPASEATAAESNRESFGEGISDDMWAEACSKVEEQYNNSQQTTASLQQQQPPPQEQPPLHAQPPSRPAGSAVDSGSSNTIISSVGADEKGLYEHYGSHSAFLADMPTRQQQQQQQQEQQHGAPSPLSVAISASTRCWNFGEALSSAAVHRFVVAGKYAPVLSAAEQPLSLGSKRPLSEPGSSSLSSSSSSSSSSPSSSSLSVVAAPIGQQCLFWAYPVPLPIASDSLPPDYDDRGEGATAGDSAAFAAASAAVVVLSLRGTWLDAPVAAGDTVHVIGRLHCESERPVIDAARGTPLPAAPPLSEAPTFPALSSAASASSSASDGGRSVGVAGTAASFAALFVVDNRNMLVLEPDLLLSPSGIAPNTECARRFILKTGGREGLSLPSEAMLLGTLKHDLFERLLVGRAAG